MGMLHYNGHVWIVMSGDVRTKRSEAIAALPSYIDLLWEGVPTTGLRVGRYPRLL